VVDKKKILQNLIWGKLILGEINFGVNLNDEFILEINLLKLKLKKT